MFNINTREQVEAVRKAHEKELHNLGAKVVFTTRGSLGLYFLEVGVTSEEVRDTIPTVIDGVSVVTVVVERDKAIADLTAQGH